MSDLYKLTVDLPSIAAVGPMELVLEELAVSVSAFAVEGGEDKWRIDALTSGMPSYDAVAALVADGARIAGIPVPVFSLAPLPSIDWVAENQKSFEPIVAGRFFVHPSRFDGLVPSGSIPIRMDAGMAFGTGSHGTTRGCLLMIDHLLKRQPLRRVLDVGCGTGILAIGCARAAKAARIAACDIDPDAVAVTRENCRLNGIPNRIRPVVSDGLSARGLGLAGAYDLVIANILAKPLQSMAPRLVSVAKRGGHILLSGLLVEQEAMVLSAYRRQGVGLEKRLHLDGWSTLLLKRRPERERKK